MVQRLFPGLEFSLAGALSVFWFVRVMLPVWCVHGSVGVSPLWWLLWDFYFGGVGVTPTDLITFPGII